MKKHFRFYKNSINSRIKFVEKLILLKENSSSVERKKYIQNIKKGYFTFLRDFVMSRFNDFKEEIFGLNKRMNKAQIFSISDKLKLKFLFSIYSSNAFVIKKMRLKGFAYKLIKQS